MKLSNQALNCIMVALQKSLMEQTDIVPMLFSFDFDKSDDGLIVKNPPVYRLEDESPDIQTGEMDLTAE